MQVEQVILHHIYNNLCNENVVVIFQHADVLEFNAFHSPVPRQCYLYHLNYKH